MYARLAFVSVRYFFFFSSRRRHTRCSRDWSSDVCSSDLGGWRRIVPSPRPVDVIEKDIIRTLVGNGEGRLDRKSTRLNSSHGYISYAVFCLKKKKKQRDNQSRLVSM